MANNRHPICKLNLKRVCFPPIMNVFSTNKLAYNRFFSFNPSSIDVIFSQIWQLLISPNYSSVSTSSLERTIHTLWVVIYTATWATIKPKLGKKIHSKTIPYILSKKVFLIFRENETFNFWKMELFSPSLKLFWKNQPRNKLLYFRKLTFPTLKKILMKPF